MFHLCFLSFFFFWGGLVGSFFRSLVPILEPFVFHALDGRFAQVPLKSAQVVSFFKESDLQNGFGLPFGSSKTTSNGMVPTCPRRYWKQSRASGAALLNPTAVLVLVTGIGQVSSMETGQPGESGCFRHRAASEFQPQPAGPRPFGGRHLPAAPDHEHQSNLRCLGVGMGRGRRVNHGIESAFKRGFAHTHTHMFVSARTWSAGSR